ncbi:amidase domain-containing protein [Streptomyces flavidovirens]|uniref:amidase domain-containing protein n=1 Tax=Streptomyces flavidovirens TaxID=67298 RepID=UPI000998E0DC
MPYGYNYSKMVGYANKHWKNANSDYRSCTNDCTNFISQAMRGGGWGNDLGQFRLPQGQTRGGSTEVGHRPHDDRDGDEDRGALPDLPVGPYAQQKAQFAAELVSACVVARPPNGTRTR